MKNLVLGAALMAGLLQAGAGCIVSSDDDDDGDVSDDVSDDTGDDTTDGSGDGFLYHANFTCPPDADIIVITATPVGSTTSQEPEEFNCSETFGEILFDPGVYDIDVVPETTAGDITFLGQTSTDVTGTDGELVEEDFDFPDNAGFFRVSWTISDDQGPLTCAEIGADLFEVGATFADDPSEPLVEQFPCDDGDAIVPADEAGWPLGEYSSIDVLLVDSNNEPISEANPIKGSFIDFADEVSDLGTIDFVVAP